METICKTVVEGGHELFVLTQCERGPFHDDVEKMGIKTSTYVLPRKPSWRYFFKHTRYLIKFCKKNEIETIWSHFPEANVIAIIAGRFLKVKVAAFRHHDESDFYANYGKQFGMVRSKKEIMLDKFINRFANPLVVLSEHVFHSIVTYENGNKKRLVVCPLIYDFPKYGSPDPLKVEGIKNKTRCQLRLIMVGRMYQSKQHMPVFEVVNKLIKEGLSIKMIVMDDGPLRPALENFVNQNYLSDHIMMPGFCDDVINYMYAADLLIHPSLTEASNNVVKEMGYLKKPVAVCDGVGDFNDYISNNECGYIMQRSDLKNSIESVIRDAYINKGKLAEMGINLKKNVENRFSDTPENKKRFLGLV
jgi:glycosyltransferase involved in cell wall biosynthesis